MRSFAFIAVVGLFLGAQAAPTVEERDEEPYIQLKLWSDMTGYVKTCSAYLNDIDGCTGWSKNFCIKRGVSNGLTCPDCNGPKTADVCGSATISLDFDADVPRATFRNENGLLSCTLKIEDTESFEKEAWCNPFEDPDYDPNDRRPVCEDPNYYGSLRWHEQGETCKQAS